MMEKKERVFNPKITIVIPAYNASRYLNEAIDSALSQSYKNIEVIVINDGSNDNGKTDKIAKSYGNRIKYYCKNNGGVSTALNLGIEKMTGEYFSWLSHDDRYYYNKIESQINYLKTYYHNVDRIVLYSDYDLMNEDSIVYKTSIKNHDELIKKQEYGILTGAINGITLLIPRRAFEECGLFNENLKCTQDYDMWLRMIKTYSFIHQPGVLASTRVHDKQETNLNPNVISEGNNLWIRIMEQIDTTSKIKLEGSEYKFYLKLYKYLKNSQYYSAIKYAKRKCKLFKNDIDYNVKEFKINLNLHIIINKLKTFLYLLVNNPKKLMVVISSKINIKNGFKKRKKR